VLQVLVVVLPVVAALMAWKLCRDLAAGDELETAKEGIRRPPPLAAPEEGQPA
jgi:hypothetical protein